MKKSFTKAVGVACLCACALWGCATIMNGTSQKIGISSTPSGAKVTVNNQALGVTPLFADLKRSDHHVVTIEMEGYQKAELTITRSVSGWVWGNVLFGGLIGLAVDAISGGLYKLSPDQLNATLAKEGLAHFQGKDRLYLVTVLCPEPNWQRIGSLQTAN